MKSMVLVMVLLSTQIAFSHSYISSQSGDFNANSTWGGAGHPQAGDTWTISGGTTVTCSGVCASGQAIPATCSVDGTVNAGGTLTVAAGATLTHSGELDVQHNATVNVRSKLNAGLPFIGTLTIAPGNGATCELNFTNISQGAPNLNLIGAAGLPGHNAYAILNCNTSVHGGTGCTIYPEIGGTNPNLAFYYFTVTGFGNARLKAFSAFVANSVNIQNGLFDRDGDVHLTIGGCGTCNFTVRNVSFTNPTDQIAGGNHYTVFEFYAPVSSGGTRSVLNLTAANQSQSQLYGAYIGMPGLQIGESILAGDPADINGFIGYNVNLSLSGSRSVSQIFRGNAVILDLGGSGAPCYGFLFNASMTFQDGFCLERIPNQHEIVAGSASSGGSANLYQRYLCDGDGFFNYDTGDMIQDWGTYTMKNSIGINLCGTMTTISNRGSEVATVTQNTNFSNFGETYCESACHDGINPVFTNNLLVKPADITNSGIRGDDGVHAASAFQRQTNLSLDYNGFYQMPGSGDPGAEPQPPVPPLLLNPALGGIIGYLNIPAAIVGNQAQKLITTVADPTHIGCSSCNFTQAGSAGVMPGDYFEDNLLRKVVTVSGVTDSTHLVLTSPGISGMHPALDTLNIYTSYWNHPGWYYGDSHNGSHDIHADPMFVDSSRTLCTWYKANTGASLLCPTYGSIMSNPGALIATSGTAGTTLHCASCNFTANGITTADIVQVFMGRDSTPRGWSTISAVSAQSLTLNMTISNLSVGDTFDFITSTQGLGKIMVQAAGFDWNGNPVGTPSWATVANAMSYIYSGFAPQNFVYRGAGSPEDGFPDIGAVPVNLNP